MTSQDKRIILIASTLLFRKTKEDQILKNIKNQARILSFYEIPVGGFLLQYVTLLGFLAMVHST